jgi:WD40 repeat protein
MRRDLSGDSIQALAIARNGSFAVAAGNTTGRMAIVALNEPFAVRWLSHSGGSVRGADVAPDGRTIAAAAGSDVLLLDPQGKLAERRLSHHRDEVYCVAFAPDGSFLASAGGGRDPAIRIWDSRSGQIRDVLQGHSNRIWCISVSPDGTSLATASDDGAIKLWYLDRRPDRTIATAGATSQVVAVGARFKQGPDDNSRRSSQAENRGAGFQPAEDRGANDQDASCATLITITSEGLAIELDARGGKRKQSRRALTRPIAAARIALDGNTAAGVTAEGSITIVDLPGRHDPVTIAEPIASPEGHRLSFDLTGERLAVEDKTTADVVVIDTPTGLINRRLPRRAIGFDTYGYTFLPDGRHLAAQRAFGHQVAVWELLGGTFQLTLAPMATDWIYALAASADGELLATGDRAGTIQLRDTETLELLATFRRHQSTVANITFAPDGRRLASGDDSGAVKLWDIASGEELIELDGLGARVDFLQFAPDGQTLVAGTQDSGGRFVVWHGRPHQSEPPDASQIKVELPSVAESRD